MAKLDFKIVKDNRGQVLQIVDQAIINALEICGGKAETYAKRECPVDNGTLRNSITHIVDPAKGAVYIGTNIEYAPYVELGTGIHYKEGVGRRTPWVYQDARGQWHRTNGQKPQPFLKPAIADHMSEYESILKSKVNI